MRLKNPLCGSSTLGRPSPPITSGPWWSDRLYPLLENYCHDSVTVEVDGVTRVLETIRETGEISSAALLAARLEYVGLSTHRDGASGAGGSDVPSGPFLDRPIEIVTYEESLRLPTH
jgi:hypothetical protein